MLYVSNGSGFLLIVSAIEGLKRKAGTSNLSYERLKALPLFKIQTYVKKKGLACGILEAEGGGDHVRVELCGAEDA